MEGSGDYQCGNHLFGRKRPSIKTADVVRLSTAVISKTATCAQYQLPPRYMVTMSMTYVPPHPIMNTPKSDLITGTGVRKHDTPIANILGIAKYAKAMLKLEKTISPMISGDDARQTPCGIRLDMICLLIGLLTQIASLKYRWCTSLSSPGNTDCPIPHLLREWEF